MVTELHAERLQTVVDALCTSGARTVLDLGCGHGELMILLAAEQRFTRIVGIDPSPKALDMAREQLTLKGHPPGTGRLSLFRGSCTQFSDDFAGFDAVVLVEVIEHIPPGNLSSVEKVVFAGCRPPTVIITTPNSEYNPLHGMAEGTMRHRDHQFEWPRDKFENWADGVAQRQHYQVRFFPVGEVDPQRGGSSQMALFSLI